MYIITTNMCHNSFGRNDHARVLIEVEALREWIKKIEVQYRDTENWVV